MKTNGFVAWMITATISVSGFLPHSVGAELNNSFRRQQVDDISLQDGSLQGHVVNAQGIGTPGIEVIATRKGKVVDWTVTDPIGSFRFKRLRPGIVTISTAKNSRICRVWKNKIAPPSAKQELLFVADQTIVRAQQQLGLGSNLFGGTLVNTLSNPLAVTGVLAAAIAIPVAVINDDDDDAS